MPLNIKPYLIILGSIIIFFILFALARNSVLEKSFAPADIRQQVFIKGILISAFLIFGAAVVPVFLKVFLYLQSNIGNGDLAAMKLLREHPMKVVYAVWAVFGLGLLLALPVMIRSGFLTNVK